MSKITLEPNPSGAGTFSIVSPDSNTNRTLNLPDESGTVLSNASDIPGSNIIGQLASSNMPVGSILQVQSVVQTQVASASGTTDTGTGADLGLSLTITPKANGSYFYITADIGIGTTTSGNSWGAILSRDGNRIGNTTSDGLPMVWFRGPDHVGNDGDDTNHGVGVSGSYMDTSGSTAGTSITFKCGFAAEGGSVKINEVESGYSGSATVAHSDTVSTFTVMEILQ